MKLNNIEKIIVAVLVIGGLLAAGIFLFIVPAYEKIGVAQRKYDALVTEKQNLDAELSREATIDTEISDAKKDAQKLEKNFYPDLTTYEASEIALAYLADNNLETLAISVSNLSIEKLGLEAYTPVSVEYALKAASRSAKSIDENALPAGQFRDNGKVYTINTISVNNITITDEEGNVVEKSKYTETMKKQYNKALCSYAMYSVVIQDVAVATVNYSVTGTYKDYLGFLDYVNNLERATKLENMVIPITVIEDVAQEDENALDNAYYGPSESVKEVKMMEDDSLIVNYPVIIKFLCVEQMEELDKIEAGGQSIVVNQ